jgi:hypothetical protein
LFDESPGATPGLARRRRALPNPTSEFGFKNKIGISRKESKEAMFFLRMVAASEEGLAEEARELWREAKELNLIFGSIWRK